MDLLACTCPDPSPRCCVPAAAACLGAHADLVAAAGRDGLDLHELASLALGLELQVRDPLAVPVGWRLHAGQLAVAPGWQVAPGADVPAVLTGPRVLEVPTASRLAGLVLAAARALAGNHTPIDELLVSVAGLDGAHVRLGTLTRAEHLATTVASSHHVHLDGTDLPVWPAGRDCPTWSSPLADVLAVLAVVTTPDGALVHPEELTRCTLAGSVRPGEVSSSLRATVALAAARTAARDGLVLVDFDLVALGRDLAGAGRPVAVGRAVVDQAGVADRVLELPADRSEAGLRLQALAAATEPVARCRRGALDVVGHALRTGRIRW